MLLLAGPKLQAQEPYAVLSEDNTTLTFYYDNQKEIRNGMDVGPFTYNYNNGINSGWYAQRESITTVVFDDSFADCTSITSTTYWFYRCNNLTTITGISNLHTDNVTNMSYMFYGCSALTSLDLTNFNTEDVNNLGSIFSGCRNLTILDLTNFNTQNVTDMSGMFYDCRKLTSLDLTNFNTQNVTSMRGMFGECNSLTSLDVSNFNTQKVTNMSEIFANCSSLTSLDVSNFNTQNVTNMSNMFGSCSSLTSLDVSNFNTQKVTDMGGMFANCSSLTSLDVRNFNTQKVYYMSVMFAGCKRLTSLDVWNFKTQNVISMFGMFSDCNSLMNLDVRNFNTRKVTDMCCMFSDCWSLRSLDVTNFNTQKVTNMSGMFSDCSRLASLDMTNFNTQNVTNMSSMFSDCSSLTSLDVTNFNTENVTNMSNMFAGCNSLTSLDMTNFNTQNVTDMGGMFLGCSSLTSLDMTNFNTQNVTGMGYMFYNCSNLTLVMIGENMSVIKRWVFINCPKLTDVYCLAVTVPNADSEAFENDYIKANTTLHVPAESISDYQATMPWCYFKNIVAIGETSTDLVDGETYNNESVVNNVNISYTRTFNNTNWQALYVPFAMSYDEWKDDFDVAEINNFHEYDDNEDGKVDRTVLEIFYVKEGSTLPNTPYLIRAKETGTKVISLVNTTLYAAEENSIDCSSVRTKYTFTGTYTGVSGEEMYGSGYYALDGGILSQQSSANVSLGSFRWYLKPESRTGNYAAPQKISVRVIGEIDGEITNIAEATVNNRQEEYYNLEGVRINRAEATGIYIVRYADGRMKKVIKK